MDFNGQFYIQNVISVICLKVRNSLLWGRELIKRGVNNMSNRICCSDCHKEVEPENEVTLDILNTITHKSCKQTGLPIKDNSIFQDIILKHHFIQELITH